MAGITRRDYLKISILNLGALGLRPWSRMLVIPDFPYSERLGRVVAGTVEVKMRPDPESNTVGVLYEDDIVPWLRDITGYSPVRTNQRWVETPKGYVWSPHLQPVEDNPNNPIKTLPTFDDGAGIWTEVSIPYVDMLLDNPPARSPWLKYRLEHGLFPRLYYSQIVWVDQIKIDQQGQVLYRVNEKFVSYGDIFWAPAEAFRVLSANELSPINQDSDQKRVVVDVTYQNMSCYEGNEEVFFSKISTGAKFNAQGNAVDVWATPPGNHPVWRKLVSVHMSGGTTGGGWDLPGVGWTSLFIGTGVAIHSTFWHNNFGVPMSRGCVNTRPEDARWVFRWTLPQVFDDPGDATVSWPGGTIIEVVER